MDKYYIENLEIDLKNKILEEISFEISRVKELVENSLENSCNTNLIGLQKMSTIEIKRIKKACWECIYERDKNIVDVKNQCKELSNKFVGLKFTELNDAVYAFKRSILTYLYILEGKAKGTIFSGKLIAIQKALNNFELQIKNYISSDIRELKGAIAKDKEIEMN